MELKLPADLRAIMDHRVRDGGYHSSAEYMRNLILRDRELQEQQSTFALVNPWAGILATEGQTAGLAFEKKVLHVCRSLARHPETASLDDSTMLPVQFVSLRNFTVPGYGYTILFVERDEGIDVLGVMRDCRLPAKARRLYGH